MICLLVITDGRLDYLRESVGSLNENLRGVISERWMWDDSGDDEYRAELRHLFPDFRHINGGPRQGFGGAIRGSWEVLREYSTARFIAHCEGDFTYNRPVYLNDMALVLEKHPHLVQLALRRQPWGPHEELAGGVVEQHPDAYTERTWRGLSWLEQSIFFTTNPSLYRRTLCFEEWPEGDRSEGRFTHQMLQAAPDARFGYWGARDSGEAVRHIGHERVGNGY